MNELNSERKPKKSKIPLYLSLLFIVILVICYFTVPTVNQFFSEVWNVLTSDDEARIKTWVEGFGWFGLMVIILAMVVQMFMLVIPTILLTIVAILAYGPIWGTIISFIAIITASTVGYSIGRYVGEGLMLSLLGEKALKKVSLFLKNYGFWAVAITRVNPFLSNDAISFVAGILKIKFWNFISATLLGISPLLILIAFMGTNVESLKSGLLWSSIASIIIFLIYVWWDRSAKRSG
jgi:uncharacterized membrane protein YdjX (TVP38/TMEM64 family)